MVPNDLAEEFWWIFAKFHVRKLKKSCYERLEGRRMLPVDRNSRSRVIHVLSWHQMNADEWLIGSNSPWTCRLHVFCLKKKKTKKTKNKIFHHGIILLCRLDHGRDGWIRHGLLHHGCGDCTQWPHALLHPLCPQVRGEAGGHHTTRRRHGTQSDRRSRDLYPGPSKDLWCHKVREQRSLMGKKTRSSWVHHFCKYWLPRKENCDDKSLFYVSQVCLFQSVLTETARVGILLVFIFAEQIL